MKILEKKYPLGSFKSQKTPGRYIDGYLYENLKILAEAIIKDMTFLAIGFSSTLEVGTGKSVLFTQIGEVWAHLINKIHGIDMDFTTKNLVWRPKALIERAFEVPRFSLVLVDEWEDAHYWSELGMTLRQFFRKCRQLNLFIVVICPNFFQFPINYAIGRSIFAIDVKFEDGFQRGFFDFYDFEKKRELYLKGKKTQNYKCVKPSFSGRFTDGYGVPEKEYRKAKFLDLNNIEGDGIEEMKPKTIEFNSKILAVKKIYDGKEFLMKEGISAKNLGTLFNIAERTMQAWIKKANDRNEISQKFSAPVLASPYIKKPKLKQDGLKDDRRTE